MTRVLVAPQEYKGTLTAVEAAEAIATALSAAYPHLAVDVLPMADGGPGTAAALLAAAGGEWREAAAHDPLMRPITASWALLGDGSAVVECAAASGLLRLRPAELDPLQASSFGTGELLRAALAAGCRSVLLGLGGSATNDGGAGMAQALGFRLLDSRGADLGPGGAALAALSRIDASGAEPAIRETAFYAATDVRNPLCGPAGASAMYGQQKGARPQDVATLDAALRHLAAVIARDLRVDVLDVPGAGAAGGLGAGAIAFLRAEVRAGAEVVGAAARLTERVRAADVVITGEGRLDGQTAFGKAPAYVASLAAGAGKPVVCLAGSLGDGYESAARLFTAVRALGDPRAPLPSPDAAKHELAAAAVAELGRFV